jgi:hypothetical protein
MVLCFLSATGVAYLECFVFFSVEYLFVPDNPLFMYILMTCTLFPFRKRFRSLLGAIECDLDEYEALVNTLEEQRDFHIERVNAINNSLDKLRGHAGHLTKDP